MKRYMKVKDMKYERADICGATKLVGQLATRLKNAKNGREIADVRAEYISLQKHVQSMCSLCYIRFTLNTGDEFYAEEQQYYDAELPKLSAAAVAFNKAFLSNPHRDEALGIINPNVAKVYELAVKVMDERIVADKAEESRLITEYDRLISGTTYRYKGKSLTLSMIRKYFEDSDRRVRREAMEVVGKTLQKIAPKLDSLFDQLVKIRSKMAVKTGFKSYSEMGDCLMGRYSYGRKEIRAFREEVKRDVVPAVARLRRAIADRLGIDRIMLYDNEICFAEGNPGPTVGSREMFAHAKKMYHALGSQTSEFIDMMLAADAFDVFPRKGKWNGGYCTSIDDCGQPFILANFNGTAGDADVLTHEAGHALAFYEQFRNNGDYELGVGTMSVAETHSMSMEFFAWKFADGFFGSRADDYKYYHLMSSMTFLPYGCMVDEFEETCYDNPEMTPSERNELWKKLDIYYRPYLETDGLPYLEKGTRWQYQMHIYENPMYYIDYCLAQNVAHQLLIESVADYDAAFDKYIAFLEQGGNKPFGELVSSVGLKNPLGGNALKSVFDELENLLAKMRK